MAKSSLSLTAKNPILLDKEHHLTTLFVIEAHKRVLHNGITRSVKIYVLGHTGETGCEESALCLCYLSEV